jgi:phosphoserine phosphatase RsbU/P
MADQWEPQTPPRLAGYESWLYQLPRMESAGDVFVSMPLSGHTDVSGELPTRWLVAVGDVSGKGEAVSRLTYRLEAEVTRLVGTVTKPASILEALNNDLADLDGECRFATLLAAVVDSNRHELTLASAGHVPPFLRHHDRRIESLAEDITGLPLWDVPGQTYENVTVPIGPGEIVIFHSDGVTALIDSQCSLFDPNQLRQAIAQAPRGAASVGRSILEAISRYLTDRAPVDDITLLCLGRAVPTT